MNDELALIARVVLIATVLVAIAMLDVAVELAVRLKTETCQSPGDARIIGTVILERCRHGPARIKRNQGGGPEQCSSGTAAGAIDIDTEQEFFKVIKTREVNPQRVILVDNRERMANTA